MKGYHYTSWENWQKIKKEGLIPYAIKHSGIELTIPTEIYGIFTWRKNHKGIAHIGNLIYQMGSKNSTRIVKLSFDYNKKDIFRYEGKKVSFEHNGLISVFSGGRKKGITKTYHRHHKAWLITRSIAPEEITLEGDYNLLKLLK